MQEYFMHLFLAWINFRQWANTTKIIHRRALQIIVIFYTLQITTDEKQNHTHRSKTLLSCDCWYWKWTTCGTSVMYHYLSHWSEVWKCYIRYSNIAFSKLCPVIDLSADWSFTLIHDCWRYHGEVIDCDKYH